MGAPQIIYIVLTGLGMGLALGSHGKPKTGKDNFFIALIASTIQIGLLIWGGFFG